MLLASTPNPFLAKESRYVSPFFFNYRYCKELMRPHKWWVLSICNRSKMIPSPMLHLQLAYKRKEQLTNMPLRSNQSICMVLTNVSIISFAYIPSGVVTRHSGRAVLSWAYSSVSVQKQEFRHYDVPWKYPIVINQLSRQSANYFGLCKAFIEDSSCVGKQHDNWFPKSETTLRFQCFIALITACVQLLFHIPWQLLALDLAGTSLLIMSFGSYWISFLLV